MDLNTHSNRFSRRHFLKGAVAAGAAISFPAIIPSSSWGASAPGNRITIGCIGVGRMGRVDMREFLGFNQVQIIAVSDVDSNRAEEAKQIVDAYYRNRHPKVSYKGCEAYQDYRELIAQSDIDAVSIVTPDHWHALPAIAAAKAGKDIFIQKPLTRTIEEGRMLADMVRRYGVVLQVGSQQRSESQFRFACELVRNGRIGRLHTVRVGLPGDPGTSPHPPMPVPKNLHYDMWLGPAVWQPYTETRVHPQQGYDRPGWLRVSDYCCGMITGWGAHHLDIAQWGMGTEYSGPVEIKALDVKFPRDGTWDVHGDFCVEYTYANGVKVICSDEKQNKQGILFEGTEGWVFVRRGEIDTWPRSLLTSEVGPGELHLYKSDDHKKNFLDCLRSRAETIAPVEVGHRSNTVCVLGYIAMQLRRKLIWNPETEQFHNDDEANRMLSRPMRSPWYL